MNKTTEKTVVVNNFRLGSDIKKEKKMEKKIKLLGYNIISVDGEDLIVDGNNRHMAWLSEVYEGVDGLLCANGSAL